MVRRPSRIATGSAPAPAGSTRRPRDLARFVAALLGGGANEHGRVLEPATLATMFEPHYQPDARLPGMGLGFFRADAAGHRLVLHDGILPGFNSELLVAPDDGIGVIGLTNGSAGAFAWLSVELGRLVRDMLDVPEDAVRNDVPHHPEVWAGLCGRYVFPPHIADLRQRLMLGGGAEVFVRGGRLMVRLLTPVPALYRGLPLQPDDETDPYVFRLDLSAYGMASVRLVFAGVVEGRATADPHRSRRTAVVVDQGSGRQDAACLAGASGRRARRAHRRQLP